MVLVTQLIISFFITEHVGFMQVRIGKRSEMSMTALIYKKHSRISSATNKEFTTGEIVNFVSTDCRNLYFINTKIVEMAQMPIYLGVTISFAFYYFGVSFFAGVGILVTALLTNILVGFHLSKVYREIMKRND